MATAGWTEHANEIVPMVIAIGRAALWLIGLLGCALIGVIGYVGRMMATRFNVMESKLDTMHQIQLMCDGCSKAASEYKRRSTDF